MSRKLTTAPTTWPSFRIGVAPYSAGIDRRSLVQSTSLSTNPSFAVAVSGPHRALLRRVGAAVGARVVEEGVRVLPDRGLRGETEDGAGGGIHEGDAALGVEAEDAVGHRAEDEPAAFLGDGELGGAGLHQAFEVARELLEAPLALHLRRDVGRDDAEPRDGARLPADREDHGQEVPDRAVDRPVLGGLHRSAALEHLALERLAPGRRFEGQDVLVLTAEHLRLRALQYAEPRLVRHEVGAVPALQGHRRRGVVEDRALALVARLGLPAGAGEDEPRGEEKGDRRAAQGEDRAAGVAQRGQGLVRVPLDDEADVEHGQPLGGADHGHPAVVRVPAEVDGGFRAVDRGLGHGGEGCRRRHGKQ